MDGTRLLRRAIKASGYTQADFARKVLRCSHRTLTRMLSGDRAITKDERAAFRALLAR